MQLGGGSGMRVRSSPFGAGGAAAGPMPGHLPGVKPPPGPGAPLQQAAPAPAPAPASNGWDDFEAEFLQETTAQPPQQQAAPQGMGVQPPAYGAPNSFGQAPNSYQQPPANAAFGQAPNAYQQPPTNHGFGQAPNAYQQPPPNSFGQAGGPSMMQGAVGAFAAATGGGAASEVMMNAGLRQVEEEMKKRGFSSWFPTIFTSLQMQFNVGHDYVLRKLLFLLCPFVKARGGVPPPAWGDTSPGGPSGNMGEDGLKVNIEDPDLYLPFMSWITYCLVYCIQRGMLNDFRADVLGTTFSFALVLFILEVCLAKAAFYIAGSVIPFLEIVGNCGYKFVHVVLMVLIRILLGGSYFYYVFFLYFAACAAFAVWRFMQRLLPSENQHYGSPPGAALIKHIVLGLAIAQIPLCWLLTPSTYGKESK
mmetsp:Transcript_127592/g.232301  ORF Transcript_127592/g.232301 Transcript_127592/m.232301 type:complete len:419 (-) Transcript_127592:59-1315(-)